MIPTALVVIPLMAVLLVLVVTGYHVARPGTALVVSKGRRTSAVLEGGVFVMPKLGSVAVLDLSERRLTFRFDDERAQSGSVSGTLELRLRPGATQEDVLRVASDLGVERANDPVALERHLDATVRAAFRAAAADVEPAEIAGDAFSDALSVALAEKLAGMQVEAVSFALA